MYNYTLLFNFGFIIFQVVAYGGLKTKENFKLVAQKKGGRGRLRGVVATERSTVDCRLKFKKGSFYTKNKTDNMLAEKKLFLWSSRQQKFFLNHKIIHSNVMLWLDQSKRRQSIPNVNI